MRKLVWYACLIAVLAAADMLGSAYYVYKYPDSLLGRCAEMGLMFGTRYNPFLFGLQTVSANVATLLHSGHEAVAPAETEDFERPDEPAAIEESEAVEPAQEEQGLLILPNAWEHGVVEEDGNVADQPNGFANTEEPPLVDPEVMPAVGVAGSTLDVPCQVPAGCEHGCGLFGWFMKAFQEYLAASSEMSDANFLRCWFGYLSSPSTLDNKGDAETSEPMDGSKPDDGSVDPYQSYHHSDCPYTGACPYSGKMPSAEPEKTDSTEQSEPMKLPKKMMNVPNPDDMEQSLTPATRPNIDTMEFRDSDRSWDDYGDPSQQ